MDLRELLDRAWERRAGLGLERDDTDTYRTFHGIAEGWPGLAIDRFGPLLLVQTFREPLDARAWDAIEAWCDATLAIPFRVLNHRGPGVVDRGIPAPDPPALAEHRARELGLVYRIRARHRGVDPWLFPDLRAGRRWVRAHSFDLRVLNVFAYTCGVGLAALAGGAAEVLNLDVSARALEVGVANLALNPALVTERFRTLAVDALCALPQLAGRAIKGWAAERDFPRLAPDQYDLVVLDPPTRATGPFGAVDILRDYPSLFVPALLATRPGGRMFATHHHAGMSAGDWVLILTRAAAKVGRPVRGIELVLPEGDFPSVDGAPPLKMAVVEV